MIMMMMMMMMMCPLTGIQVNKVIRWSLASMTKWILKRTKHMPTVP